MSTSDAMCSLKIYVIKKFLYSFVNNLFSSFISLESFSSLSLFISIISLLILLEEFFSKLWLYLLSFDILEMFSSFFSSSFFNFLFLFKNLLFLLFILLISLFILLVGVIESIENSPIYFSYTTVVQSIYKQH